MEQEMVQQDEARRGLSWLDLGGVTLLLLGVVFMAVNLFGVRQLENWWSVFILLPGILFLGLGKGMWRGDGRFAFLPRLSTGLGIILVTIALMFVLELNWAVWWPMMIMMPGVMMWLVGGAKYGVGVTAVLRLGHWLGGMMILLGFTFLADQHHIVNLQALFGQFHWWGFFILIPGAGAFIEGLRVLRQSTWASMGLFFAGVWIVSSGLLEIFALNWLSWEGMVGLGLIGTGLLSRGWLLFRPDTSAEG